MIGVTGELDWKLLLVADHSRYESTARSGKAIVTLLSGKFLQIRKIPLLRLTKFQGIIFSSEGLNFARILQFKS